MLHELNTEFLCPNSFVKITRTVKSKFDIITSKKSIHTLLLSFIILITCSISLQAQDQVQAQDENVSISNPYFTGLTASFRKLRLSNGNSTNNYSFSPSIGKFLNEHFAIGLNVGYRFSDISFFGGNDLKQLNTSVFMRYIINPENKLQAYLQPSLQYLRSKDESNNGENITNAYAASVNFGITYDITDRFRFLTRLADMSYMHNSSIQSPIINNSIYSLDIDFSNIQFGAEYRF